MIKNMAISIQVSGETEGECIEALQESLRDIITDIPWMDTCNKSTGNLDEGEEEIHWKYEITTVNG